MQRAPNLLIQRVQSPVISTALPSCFRFRCDRNRALPLKLRRPVVCRVSEGGAEALASSGGFRFSRVRAGAFLNTLAPGPPSGHCAVTPFPYWLLFAFRLCKLLLNSPACELEVVGFDACTVAAHSAAYVLRPWDGFRLGRSAFNLAIFVVRLSCRL